MLLAPDFLNFRFLSFVFCSNHTSNMIHSISVTAFCLLILTFNCVIEAHSNTSDVDDISLTKNKTHDYDYYDSVSGTSHNESRADTEEESRVCQTSTCVRKCCGEGKYLNLHDTYGCVDHVEADPKFELQFRHKDGRPAVPDKPVHLLYGSDLKICPLSYGLLPEHRDAILLSDGRLYTNHDDTSRNASRYCLDVIRRDDEHFGIWPITCYEQFKETPRTLFRYYGHATSLILSSVSLLFIIVCHAVLPKLRDLSGLCLLSYASCLLIADVALLVVSLNSHLDSTSCVVFGIIIYASFIAAYSWLTVICFDVWRLVRMSVRGVFCSMLHQQERRLFACYSAVVWGAILVITCTTCTLHFLPQEALPDYVIRPHFGVERCFIINEDANLFAYFFSILAVLALIDVVFVSITVCYLYEAGVTVCFVKRRVPSPGDSVVFNNKDLDTFWQRFQIFAMTVVVWTTEVLSWKIPPKELWEATDLLNALQGVILLIIFLLSKRNRQLLLAKACSLAGKSQAEELGLPSRGESSKSSQVISANLDEGPQPRQVVGDKSNGGESSQPNPYEASFPAEVRPSQ